MGALPTAPQAEQNDQQRRETVRRIKETADIAEVVGEHVTLQRAGANLKGLCPFHAEKTPSFMVSPGRGSFHCFGCGEGGDVFNFLMLYHRIGFPEALKQLADRYRIPLAETSLSPQQREEARRRESLYAINARAATLYHQFLLHDPAAAPAREYLAQRGMTAAIIEAFQLGYAPERWDFLRKHLEREKFTPATAAQAGLLASKESGATTRYYDRFRHRIIFPIIDQTGRVAGFGGRILGEGEPKYLNTAETPIFDKGRILYGLYQHRDALRKARSCLLVEGNFDLLTLAAGGVEEVVAPLGTALSAGQLRILRGYVDEVVLLFDGDAAGLKAAMRAVPLFLAEKLSGRVAILPEGQDPDSYIRAHGRQGLWDLVAGGESLAEFVFNRLTAEHGLGVEGKNRIIAELAPIVHELDDQQLLRTRFIAHFSEKLGISGEQFSQSIGRPAARRPAPAASATSDEDWSLDASQRRIFAFLFFHGQHLPDFLAAGLKEYVSGRAAQALLELMMAHQDEFLSAPEVLLEHTEGRLKSLVSGLLIDGGDMYPEAQQEESARELLAWLQRHRRRHQAEALVREINAAHLAGDQQRVLTLMRQKQTLFKE
ncbi:MAG: DNA primase [Desulfurivibrio sp.]|nr:DNA primase [Desulfurivibrio sp.]